MTPSETGRPFTITSHSNEGTQTLRSSIYSLALSANTILPQYSASTEEIECPVSFEQDIRGETYRFQVLSEQRPQSHNSVSRSSFQSDRTVRPPRYSTISTSYQSVEPPNEDPLTVQHYEHAFSVQSKKPWATVYMFTPKTISGMPKTSQTRPNVPAIYGQEPVLGMLELDIDTPKAIEQITISLQGRIWNGYTNLSTKMLDQSYLLWRKLSPAKEGKLLGSHQLPFSFQLKDAQKKLYEYSNTQPSDSNTSVTPYEEVQSPASSSSSKLSHLRGGQTKGSSKWSTDIPENPRAPNSQSDLIVSPYISPYQEMRSAGSASSSTSQLSPPSARPTPPREKGQSTWSLPLRSSASSPRLPEPLTRPDSPDPLPPSFKEKGIPASIEYTLSIRIQRRLRPDNIIKTEVSYVPSTVAEAASLKRQSAHAAGTVSPGPYHDSEGWFALPNAIMRGEVNGRPILINSTLHIGNPRSYCRGTTIPCYLTFSSSDIQYMRLICNPDAPLVRLTRRLRQFESRRVQPLASSSVTPFRDEITPEYDRECVLTKCTILTLGMWRVPSKRDLESLEYKNCYLEGEIHLEDNLLPSYSSRLFTIEYTVELLPLISDIFKASEPGETSQNGDGKGILASSLVSITTLRSPGEPVPVKFSELPQYGKFPEVKKDESGWNNRSFEQFGLI